jgi:SAM-dependent methyltransferase
VTQPVDSRALNQAYWDDRAAAHARSAGYHRQDFLADPAYLSEVVRFDQARLGDLAGRRGVHLQCHIGTDTVSLARLGADMTGLDFSGASIGEARALAAACPPGAGREVTFVEADVDDAVSALAPSEGFDLVYTGIGALCWLPDVTRWARVVSDLLAPGGRLFIREGHPMLWALDEHHTDRLALELPYFERPEPLDWDEEGTYVATDVSFAHNRTHSWNHGLGEVVSAVLDAGLRLTGLVEHTSVPWDALPGQMVLRPGGEWELADRPWRLAATYTLQAVKVA